ncbi:MAG TPA: hypothetical protein PLR90_01370 [Methylophilus sp.]|nr:hypothetical protein [Methylophilus sp.]HQQ32541.1 hypothetical protein [Methylophilus sp.]
MQAWLIKLDEVAPKKLFWWIVSFSIALAAWIQYIQHGWINPDSVIYFEQARLIAAGDWHSAIQIFNWPLYGFCIALIHKLTLLDIHSSAQILNSIFFGIATASYLKIIQICGGNTRVMLSGAFILFSSQYIVGDALSMLLRDEGFWAFYLASLFFFIRYLQQEQIRDALIWQVCIMIATLFRIEGISYLIGLPLIFLFLHHQHWLARLKHLLYTNSLSILTMGFIATTILINKDLSMKNFGRLQEVFTTNFYQEFTAHLQQSTKIMSEQVLGKYLDEYAVVGLLVIFAYIIIVKIISTTGIIPSALNFFALKQGAYKSLEKNAHFALRVVALIAVFNMALIIIKVFVLSGRYVIALSWILMILASFYLSDLVKTPNRKHVQIGLLVLILLFSGMIKNILPKHEGYNYLQDAVAWTTATAPDDKIFYDDCRMRYYAKAPFAGKWDSTWSKTIQSIENKSIYQNDFLILTLSANHPERIPMLEKHLLEYKEIKRFYSDNKKKYAAIYRKVSSHK